jgi:hypothetical protein
MTSKKAETALAIRNTASIAATAWNRLEAAAHKAMDTACVCHAAFAMICRKPPPLAAGTRPSS